MKLIEPQDPRYFTETCSKYYDRHDYKVISQNGNFTLVNSWQKAQELWWNNKPFLSHIEVLDKVVEKNRKGFK